MPRKKVTYELIAGPYAMPPCEPGSSLVCKLRGRVTVVSFT